MAGVLGAMLVGVAAAQLPPSAADLVQNLQKYRRTVLAYLRTENADLALIELERLELTWTADVQRAGSAIGQDAALAAAVIETQHTIRNARRGRTGRFRRRAIPDGRRRQADQTMAPPAGHPLAVGLHCRSRRRL